MRKEIPTERTELTEPLAEKSLPQMAQMFTDVGRHTKFVLFELFVFVHLSAIFFRVFSVFCGRPLTSNMFLPLIARIARM